MNYNQKDRELSYLKKSVPAFGTLITILILLFPVLFFPTSSKAQDLYTYRNFGAEQMGTNSPVIWDMVQDANGVIYCANSAGVMAFDGEHWHIFPTSTQVRSLAIAKNGRIFVGGVSDFGSLEVNEEGSIAYVSYKKLLGQKVANYGSIDKIIVQNEKVYFYADEVVFILENPNDKARKLSAIRPDNSFKGIAEVQGQIWVYQSGKDDTPGSIIEISKGKPAKLSKQFGISGIYKSFMLKNHKSILISDDYQPFIYSHNELEGLAFSANNIIAGYGLTNGRALFATEEGEILITDGNNQITKRIDGKNILPSSYIFTVFEDQQGGIWVSHSKGLTRIGYNSAVIDWSKYSLNLGNIRALFAHNQTLYVGTLQGLFALESNATDFRNVAGINNEVSNINFVHGRLLACTSVGVYDITNGDNTLIKLPEETGQVYRAIEAPNNETWIAHSYGIVRLKNNGSAYEALPDILTSKFPILNAVFDTNGDIWLSTMTNGAILLRGNKTEIFDADKGLADGKIAVMKVDGELIFYSQIKGYFRKEQDKFIPIPALNIYKTENNYLTPWVNNNNQLWILGDHGAKLITYSKGGKVTEITESNAYFAKHKITTVLQAANSYFVASYDKFWQTPTQAPSAQMANFRPLIRSVFGTGDTLLSSSLFPLPSSTEGKLQEYSPVLDSKEPLVLDYNFRDLRFAVSATSYEADAGNEYQYFLDGYDQKWSEWTHESIRAYSNLQEGGYVLKVKARNAYGQVSADIAEYHFSIRPPWYRHWLSYIAYIFGIVAITIGGVRLYNKRLVRKNEELEKIVSERTHEISQQKTIIEHKNEHITQSIVYAQRIQNIILPHIDDFQNDQMEAFIYYKPKDIVSGDFYWLKKYNGLIYIAAIDCTGHGVPGAFMSLIGFNLINEAFEHVQDQSPGKILDYMDEGVRRTLKQNDPNSTSKDGMDMTLIQINLDKQNLVFSGAFRPLLIIRNGEPIEYKGDRNSIGGFDFDFPGFANTTIDLQKNDMVYMYSDGITDQFGGPDKRKFTGKRLTQILIDNQAQSMETQKKIIDKAFEEWKQDNEQLDDVMLIGIRFKGFTKI